LFKFTFTVVFNCLGVHGIYRQSHNIDIFLVETREYDLERTTWTSC